MVLKELTEQTNRGKNAKRICVHLNQLFLFKHKKHKQMFVNER